MYAFTALTYKWHHEVKCCVRVCNNETKIPAHFAKLRKTEAHEAWELINVQANWPTELKSAICRSKGYS